MALLNFEHRVFLAEDRANGRREPADCWQGLSGSDGWPTAVAKPSASFLASTVAIIAPGEPLSSPEDSLIDDRVFTRIRPGTTQ